MKGDLRAELSNIAGALIHSYNAGKGAEAGCLFSADAAATLPFREDAVKRKGVEAIRTALCETVSDLHFLHTPVFEIDPSGTAAKGVWMSLSLFASCGPEKEIEPSAGRFWIRFEKEEDAWKIKELEYRVFTSILPQPLGNDKVHPYPDIVFQDADARNGWEAETDRACDYEEIQNLQSRYIYDQGDCIVSEFCSSEAAYYQDVFLEGTFHGRTEIGQAYETLKTKIRENGGSAGWYGLMTPLIRISPDGNTAFGYWNTFGFVIRGKGYGVSEETAILNPVIGVLCQEFQKESGTWKFKTFRHQRILSLENWLFTPGRPSGSNKANIGQIQLQGEGEWKKPELAEGAAMTPEDFWEINELESWDISCVNTGCTSLFPEKAFAKECPDVSAMISSPGAKEHRGQEEITLLFQKFEELRVRQGNSQSVHSASTPYIRVRSDGRSALSRWLDIGWTVHGSGMGNETPPYPVVPVFGMYEHEAVKENEHWKLKTYRFYAMLQMHSWLADPNKSKGWSSGEQNEPWPLP